MDSKNKFIPKCFEKDLTKLSKGFTLLNKKSDRMLSREIYINILAKDVYTIIKNLDFSINKCHTIEYSKQRLKLKEAYKLFRVSKNCDCFILKILLNKFKIFNYNCLFKMIRFYSYSNVNNCYFFLFQFVDEQNDKIKHCKGGIIIPTNEKKIIFYMKRSKRLSVFNHKMYFDMLIENSKIILEVMGKFITPQEVERLSTVESLEADRKIIKRPNNEISIEEKVLIRFSYSTCDKAGRDICEETFDTMPRMSKMSKMPNNESPLSSCSDRSEGDGLINFGDLDLDLIDKESDFIIKSQYDSNFIIDDTDEDYIRIRKLSEDDLEKVNLLTPLNKLKNELEKEIKEFNISENEMIRYIFGWKGDVLNVKKTLVELQHWRRNYKPNAITLNDFSSLEFDLEQLMSIVCQDIYGRPIILIKAKYFIPSKLNIEVFIKYLIFIHEKAIQMMPSSIDKLAIVIDVKDAGVGNFSMPHIKPIKEQSSKFYVERLSNIIVINKGFFFGLIWKVVSNFLEERVLKKIVVVDEKKMAWLRKVIGPNAHKIGL